MSTPDLARSMNRVLNKISRMGTREVQIEALRERARRISSRNMCLAAVYWEIAEVLENPSPLMPST